ncbi:hypothetical protein K1719_020524 [Acacia pycnantha]|nr:hypothetical protein K1719_020524 [Acacia pycnantha]
MSGGVAASEGASPSAFVSRRLCFPQTPSPFLLQNQQYTLTVIYMRGLVLFAAKKKFKQISKLKGSEPCGVMASSPPKKQANNEFSEEKPITKRTLTLLLPL